MVTYSFADGHGGESAPNTIIFLGTQLGSEPRNFQSPERKRMDWKFGGDPALRTVLTKIKNIVHAITKLANLRTFFKVHQLNWFYIN